MKTQDVLQIAGGHLSTLVGHEFDVLTITKPVSPEAAVNLSRIVSKLSPMLGNLIEFNTVEFLNTKDEFKFGHWRRQDPGFPDTVFDGVTPTPGFEIKAWFPLATEITARFRDSQNHFTDEQTNVAMLAWLPEFVIYGKPQVVGVCIVSGLSVAQARDNHYHNPPYYLVIEPQDTSARAANLQQTNTAGYVWQGDRAGKAFVEASAFVQGWGEDAHKYKPTPDYQKLLAQLMAKYQYRLDTNYAKMDRIFHDGLEKFKTEIDAKKFQGMTIGQWRRLLSTGEDKDVQYALEKHLGIKAVLARSPIV